MRLRTILVLCSVLLAAACSRDSANRLIGKASTAPKAPAVAKKGPSAEQQTAGMTLAVGIGKATLPMQLKFELADRPKAGQALNINLALLPQIPADGAVIQVRPSDGIEVAKAASEIAVPALDEGGVYRETLNVTPTKDGVLLVGVNLTLKHDDIEESKGYSVPLIVGEPPAK
jgi:hypothetical protein